MAIQKGGGDRRRRHGLRHRGPDRQRRRPRAAARYSVQANGGDRKRAGQGRDPTHAQDRAGAIHAQGAAAKLVEPGNTEDDLERLAEVDWIVEVVVEDLEIKRALYARIEAVRKDGSIVSSNTSTLPLGHADRRASPNASRRLPDHPLLQSTALHAPARTGHRRGDPARSVGRDSRFRGPALGQKSCVLCNDTPGFVANRIGNFWLQCAVNAARDHGLTVEEADAVMSPPHGHPQDRRLRPARPWSASISIPKVDASLAAALPEGDAYHGIRRDWDLLDRLIAEGYTGRKGKGGFYRLDKSGGKRVKQALEPGERRLRGRRQADPGKPERQQGRRPQGAGRPRGPRRAIRLGGAVPDTGLCRDPRPRDHRQRFTTSTARSSSATPGSSAPSS